MNKFWTAALGVGGLGAVGAFVFLSLYMKWLTLTPFSQLTSDQTFALMCLFLGFVFAEMIVLAIVYVSMRGKGSNTSG